MKKPSTLSPEITPEVAQVKIANLPESLETPETPEASQETETEETAEQVSMEDLLPGEDESNEASQPEPEQEAGEAGKQTGEAAANEESLTSQVAQPATSSLSDADDLVSQLINAKRRYRAAEVNVENIKEELKEAKAHMEGCASRVMKIIDELEGDSDRPLFYGMEGKARQPVVSPMAPVIPAPPATDEEAEQPESNFDPDAWKSEPLSVLADSEGITAKLLEKLAESDVNTLGDLESLRAEIANAQSVWPKGIGEKKITAIENAIVEWLAKWNAVQQAAAVNTETGDTETGEDAGQGDGETEASNPEATFGEGYPTEEEWNAMHDETQISWLNARAVFLEEKAAAHPDGVMDGLDNNPEGTDTSWSVGANAAQDGEEIANCELVPGLECDAWLMGWLWQSKQQGEEDEV